MIFLNLSLLAGSAMVAVPIILHMIMRRKPVRLEFPALRFIQRRADVNRRRLRLQHLLLLLLRAAAIALLALALARPIAKFSGALGSQEAPVAAALVFDAAPHMDYRHENRSRLDAAREMGLWLLSQLPESSKIAVLDTRLGTAAAFQVDRGSAQDRIAHLQSVANSQPLPVAVAEAAKLLADSQLRKEIYVFTDLSRGAWPAGQAEWLRQHLSPLADFGVYVIDVGAADPTDYALGEVRLSDDVLSSRSTLKLNVGVSGTGAPAARAVELYVTDAAGRPQKRDQQSCEIAPGEARPVAFQVGGLEPGVHQGYLRIVGEDGLAADDVRFFTIKVKPAWRLLLAAPEPAESYALFLREALAPAVYRRRGQARFDCDVCDLRELAKRLTENVAQPPSAVIDQPAQPGTAVPQTASGTGSKRPLAEYSAVFLLDPKPLDPAVWKRLTDFAAEGHGVGVFLGRNAMPVASFNEPQAQELLAGKLLGQVPRPDGDLWLAPAIYEHPILSAFRSRAGAVPWDAFPVFRYWEVDPSAKGVGVVLPYNDGRPAVLERPVGQGRSLLMTTPVSDRPSQEPWNLLPAEEAWPFMILVNKMAEYLVGSSTEQLNYYAGQTAIIQLDAAARRQGYMLYAPDDLTVPYPPDISRRELVITPTDRVGNYRIEGGGAGGVRLGFSVNYAPEQTRLDRLDGRELAETFGPIKFRLARTRQQIDRDVSQGRVGRELFPPLILLVALMLGAEMVLANRFYRE